MRTKSFSLLMVSWIAATSLIATPAVAENVVQVDIAPGEVPCPQFGDTDVIPGLIASIKTSGRPVLVSYVIGFNSSPFGNMQIIPVINGVDDTAHQLGRAIGDYPSGQSDVVTFTRLYELPKGSHDFALKFTCQSAMNVVRGWLILQELDK